MARMAVLVLGLTALLATGCSAFQAAPKPVAIMTIGADLSLSGADATTGKVLANALELAVEQLNKQGTVSHGKFVLSLRDNRSDPKASVDNVRAFQHNASVVAAVTGPSDDCLAAAAPVVQAGDLPVISLSPLDLPNSAPEQGSPLFKLAPNPVDDATALVALLAGHKAHTATVVAAPGRYGKQLGAAVHAVADARDLSLAASVPLSGSAGSVADKVMYQGAGAPDAVLIAAGAGKAGDVVSALHARGFRGTVALDATDVDNVFLPNNALSGAYLVFPAILSMDDQVASTPAKAAQRQWFDSYTSRYGSYSADSGFAADAVQLIATAVGAAGGTDRDLVRAAVETTQIDGLSGPIRYTPDNHSALTPQSLVTLEARNRRWHLITDANS